ncbi:MAG TPA: hypothetical protein VM056_05935 [Terriglobales bacterium]|nr:hypothetical protein [Terriglobales bacterium]
MVNLKANVYPLSAEAARQIYDRFAQYLASEPGDTSRLKELLPPVEVIEAIISAAFWASLRREENAIPKISLAYITPEHSKEPLIFHQPLALSASELARLSPAVERPGIHLGVWHHDGELKVWGTTRSVPRVGFVLEVVAPGLLVIKHRRLDGPGKFVNVAVLEGDKVSLLDHSPPQLSHCPALLSTLLGFESPSAWVKSSNVLVQLAVSMRNHGRGGTLLLVPAGSTQWRESIAHPIKYGVSPTYGELGRLLQADASSESDISRAVAAIAGLTAVDGATVLSDNYDLLAFGAKIRRREGSAPLERICVLEPVVGSSSSIVAANVLGGTRHLSTAQFVHDQPDAVGLVASQDGEFTIFLWSADDKLVHAHRITVFML